MLSSPETCTTPAPGTRLTSCSAGSRLKSWQLFDLVRQSLESIGPVTLVPYRDRVAFMVRVRFGGVRPRKHWLDVDFWLTRRVESPRFQRSETLSPYTHIYTVRVTDPSEVDGELAGWLRDVYAVGVPGTPANQAPLRSSASLGDRAAVKHGFEPPRPVGGVPP